MLKIYFLPFGFPLGQKNAIKTYLEMQLKPIPRKQVYFYNKHDDRVHYLNFFIANRKTGMSGHFLMKQISTFFKESLHYVFYI